MLVDRKISYIDPQYCTHSYIEGKLIEIMEQYWEEMMECAEICSKLFTFFGKSNGSSQKASNRKCLRFATTSPNYIF